MFADLWPTFGLTLSTARLVLRLPTDSELEALARVAADGVHGEDERPFLTPWAEGSPEERARSVLGSHWSALASWTPDSWRLGLGVFLHTGEAIGVASLRAADFRVNREVTTSSWLGLGWQGQGYGTEARTALLTLAFDHLGATDATTEVFQDNHKSQGVSRKLGYLPDGISRDRRGEDVVVSDRLRLTSELWGANADKGEVEVSGVDEALPMFLGDPRSGDPAVPT
ncbi:GNAT family N-acetyltransferase [Phycicoccus sp. Soil802]|uniref:GNAT family N-acetyltransferase n=1 Tax=Phycicoccus sp. Soil802 TaxID=1736414 RepID=UPI0007037CA6|nr:GNAT family N-acetyltransferase [Phycicoccus sp. Soil802]KRF28342.1 GCN5 family acetyltransferase [Phycicoccus sp. Soil802]